MIRKAILVFILIASLLVTSVPSMKSVAAQVVQGPRYGGTLVLGIADDPVTLTTFVTTDINTVIISGMGLFNTLIGLTPDTYQPIPDLATSWSISSDGLTYTFHLAKNVTFHDGNRMTSDDVKFTFQNLAKTNGMASNIYTSSVIKSIDTPDNDTVVFHLTNPSPGFLLNLADVASGPGVVEKRLYEGTDMASNPANFKPVGTGPFMFKEWVKGDHVTLVKNPNYFKKGKPYLDSLVFKIIPTDATRALTIKTGEINMLPYFAVPAASVQDLMTVPGLNVTVAKRLANGQVIMFFNLRHPPLNNVKVRQAIAYALNLTAIAQLAGRDIALKPGTSPIPSGQASFYNPNVVKYPYNVAKANQLLDDAGYPMKNGVRFSLRISTSNTPTAYAKALDIMKEELGKVGIDVQEQPMDTASWTQISSVNLDFDLTFNSYAQGGDPTQGVSRLYLSNNIGPGLGRNIEAYNNSKVDQLFSQAASNPNETARKQLYYEVQNIIMNDLPVVPLWENRYNQVVSTQFRDVPPGPTMYERLDGVWWVNGQAVTSTSTATSAATSTPSTTATGLGPNMYYYAAAALIIVIVASMLYMNRRRKTNKTT